MKEDSSEIRFESCRTPRQSSGAVTDMAERLPYRSIWSQWELSKHDPPTGSTQSRKDAKLPRKV